MWPKALTQLVELAPHVTRLLPLADRYFRDRATGDQATRGVLEGHQAALQTTLEKQRSSIEAKLEAALEVQLVAITGLTERLGVDLSAAAAAHTAQAATLQRQINDFEKHLVTTRTDALAAKQATETLEGRLARMETTQRRAYTLAIVAVALLAAILALIATLFLRAR